MSTTYDHEFAELQADLQALEADLGDFEAFADLVTMDPSTVAAYAELDAGIEAAGLAGDLQSASLDAFSVDGDPELEALARGFLARRARAVVARVVEIAKKHRRCLPAVQKVTNAVKLLVAGRYLAAIAAAIHAGILFSRCK